MHKYDHTQAFMSLFPKSSTTKRENVHLQVIMTTFYSLPLYWCDMEMNCFRSKP